MQEPDTLMLNRKHLVMVFSKKKITYKKGEGNERQSHRNSWKNMAVSRD